LLFPSYHGDGAGGKHYWYYGVTGITIHAHVPGTKILKTKKNKLT